MGNCKNCNKKLGIFEGYDDFDGEYCEKCYHSPSKIKHMKEQEKEKKLNKLKGKEKKLTTKENKIGLRVIIIIIIAIVVLLYWNPFSNNNDEYGRCVDSCIYENEFCADDFAVNFAGVRSLSINSYDKCHNDLKYCLRDCER